MVKLEQLDHLYMRAGLGTFHLKDYAMECEYDRCIYGFARAIEAEVRKDDEALIRWMLDALEYHTMQTRPITKTDKVMAAARARLEKAP